MVYVNTEHFLKSNFEYDAQPEVKNDQGMVPQDHMSLTHCGLVTAHDSIELDQHWFRYWLGAIRQQAITWTNVDLSSKVLSSIHLREILTVVLMNLIHHMCSEITLLKLLPNPPGANKLTHWSMEDAGVILN